MNPFGHIENRNAVIEMKPILSFDAWFLGTCQSEKNYIIPSRAPPPHYFPFSLERAQQGKTTHIGNASTITSEEDSGGPNIHSGGPNVPSCKPTLTIRRKNGQLKGNWVRVL